MHIHQMKFCPTCTQPLGQLEIHGEIRLGCVASGCDFVHWGNPTPVVAIIVEKAGAVVMAHNVAWPPNAYSVITGFLEAGEDPMECAIRETREELGLQVTECALVGCYGFARQNQVIIAYHAIAEGDIVLNEELDDYRLIEKEKLKVYPLGTGLALKDWLEGQGVTPEIIPV